MFFLQVLSLLLVVVKNSQQKTQFQLYFLSVNPNPPPMHCFYETFDPVPTTGVTKAVQAYEDSGTREWMFGRSYIGPVMDIKTCHRDLGKKIFFEFGLVDYNFTDEWLVHPAYSSYGVDVVTRRGSWELRCEYTDEGEETCLNVQVSCLKGIGELVEGKYMRVEVMERVGRATRCVYIKSILKAAGIWNFDLDIGVPAFTLPDPLRDQGGCLPYRYFGFILSSMFCMMFFCCFIPLYSHPDVVFDYKVDAAKYDPYNTFQPPPPPPPKPEVVPDITLSVQIIHGKMSSGETVDLIT